MIGKKILEEMKKLKITDIIETEVKPYGTSGRIGCSKKHIGKKCVVFIHAD